MNGAYPLELVPQIMNAKAERRCFDCGAKASGKKCMSCGSAVRERLEIGLLAGVANNYGTVQNVYNLATPQTDVVDLRDIQDSLNERFPERALPRRTEPLALPPRRPSGAVKFFNVLFKVFGLFLLSCLAITIFYLCT